MTGRLYVSAEEVLEHMSALDKQSEFTVDAVASLLIAGHPGVSITRIERATRAAIAWLLIKKRIRAVGTHTKRTKKRSVIYTVNTYTLQEPPSEFDAALLNSIFRYG